MPKKLWSSRHGARCSAAGPGPEVLARLLRWLLLAQILTGALLGWLAGIPVLLVHGYIGKHRVWDDLATAR